MKVMFFDAAPSLMPLAATYSEKPSSAADSASTNKGAGEKEGCVEHKRDGISLGERECGCRTCPAGKGTNQRSHRSQSPTPPWRAQALSLMVVTSARPATRVQDPGVWWVPVRGSRKHPTLLTQVEHLIIFPLRPPCSPTPAPLLSPVYVQPTPSTECSAPREWIPWITEAPAPRKKMPTAEMRDHTKRSRMYP